MRSLEGRGAPVTGASRRIGLELTRRLAAGSRNSRGLFRRTFESYEAEGIERSALGSKAKFGRSLGGT